MATNEEFFMTEALKEARKAMAEDEVPVGAVAVLDGKIIARARNRKEHFNDATKHAEMLLLEKCARVIGNWYLEGVEVYVTLEPCAMCAGAMLNARIRSLTFGASEPKSGCAGSKLNLLENNGFNHTVRVTGGVLAEISAKLLSDFFKRKRI